LDRINRVTGQVLSLDGPETNTFAHKMYDCRPLIWIIVDNDMYIIAFQIV